MSDFDGCTLYRVGENAEPLTFYTKDGLLYVTCTHSTEPPVREDSLSPQQAETLHKFLEQHLYALSIKTLRGD